MDNPNAVRGAKSELKEAMLRARAAFLKKASAAIEAMPQPETPEDLKKFVDAGKELMKVGVDRMTKQEVDEIEGGGGRKGRVSLDNAMDSVVSSREGV